MSYKWLLLSGEHVSSYCMSYKWLHLIVYFQIKKINYFMKTFDAIFDYAMRVYECVPCIKICHKLNY